MTKAEKQARDEADADVRTVMGTRGGRRFFWRLLLQSGLQTSSMADTDRATAYNEGRRAVALALLAEVQAVCPELYALSLRERLDTFQVQGGEALPKPSPDE